MSSYAEDLTNSLQFSVSLSNENVGEKATSQFRDLMNEEGEEVEEIIEKEKKPISSKDQWIKEQLKIRASQFTETRKTSVVIGTWNVNSKVPDSGMDEWLRFDINPDVIAIGLQEIDMTAQAMIKQETQAGDLWVQAIEKELQRAKSIYKRVVAKQLVGMYLAIYVKSQFEKYIKDVRQEAIGVGAMNKMGNKGGVAARFNIYETTFCFVCAHLAAHQKEVDKRNQNVSDIMQRIDFNGGSNYYPEKHDYFFWFGDLNYRIDGLPDDEVKQKVKEGKFQDLLDYDQLTIEKNAGRVFWGFEEGPINFGPTYKYDPGTLTFDTSEKRRTPSYTDRILWKGYKKDKMIQEYYGRTEILTSDHLPVSSVFQVDVDCVIDYKYRECLAKVMRDYNQSIGNLSNDENTPEIELSQETIVFENVQYNVPQLQTLYLTAKGKMVCEFNFVPKPMEDQVSKPWIKLSPSSGLIVPGGEKAEIVIKVLVDQSTAPELNVSDGSLDDTLVIHLENGRDYFVNIKGNYLRSCYGSSLSNLVCYFETVRFMKTDNFLRVKNSRNIKKPAIPKELWRMIDYIIKYGVREPNIFQETGNSFEVSIVREKLDCGDTLSDFTGSIHSVIECLMTFLESLPEPVIPKKFYKKCIEYSNNKTKMQEIVEDFPPVHYNTFHYLMAFLREILMNSDANGLSPDNIAHGFAHVVLPSPKNLDAIQKNIDHSAKIQMLKMFLYEDPSWASKSDEQLFKPVI